MPHKPFALCCLLLSACASRPAEPVIKTVEVKVPVAIQCPDKRQPWTDPLPAEALANAPGIYELSKLYAAAIVLMRARIAESDAQVSACSQPPPGVTPAPRGPVPSGR